MIEDKLDLRPRSQVTALLGTTIGESKVWDSFMYQVGNSLIRLNGATEAQVVETFQKLGYVHVATNGYSLANQGSIMCLPDRRFPISIPRYGSHTVTVVGAVYPQIPKLLAEFELLSSPTLRVGPSSVTLEFKANSDKVPARYGDPIVGVSQTNLRYEGCQYLDLSVSTIYQNFVLTFKEE